RRDRGEARPRGPTDATMGSVAYFTAVIAPSGAAWRARGVEVDDASTPEDLTAAPRSVSGGAEPVLAVIEHEDEWFALVRVDGDEEPRLFVSDLAAAGASPYGPLSAPPGGVDREEAVDGADDEEDDESEDDEADEPKIAVWAGETDLLEDLGV